jgi:cytochrome P450
LRAAAAACGVQAHGLQGYNGMLTHQDEGTWKAARRAMAPAFTISEVK